MDYKLIYVKNKRGVSITVKNGGVTVRAPKGAKTAEIDRIVTGKTAWIEKILSKQAKEYSENRPFIERFRFLLFGETYTSIEEITAAITNSLSGTEENRRCASPDPPENSIPFTGRLRVALYIDDKKQFGAIKELVEKYIELAGRFLKTRLTEIAENIFPLLTGGRIADGAAGNKQKNSQKVKALKLVNGSAKWGMCTTKGIISLNWRLILLPPDLIDFVIVHELCHFAHMNHSKAFWSSVAQFIPGLEKSKKEMKRFGFVMKLFR